MTSPTPTPDAAQRLLGRDTPWPIELLLKALVVAEAKLREDGRDFDGWESIQTAAQVAQQRLNELTAILPLRPTAANGAEAWKRSFATEEKHGFPTLASGALRGLPPARLYFEAMQVKVPELQRALTTAEQRYESESARATSLEHDIATLSPRAQLAGELANAAEEALNLIEFVRGEYVHKDSSGPLTFSPDGPMVALSSLLTRYRALPASAAPAAGQGEE